MPGSRDLVASAPEQWCLAREALMSEPRAKFERQKSNAQNGGQEDKGVLLSCSCSDFVHDFGWFYPRLPAPHSHGVTVTPGVDGVLVPCMLTP